MVDKSLVGLDIGIARGPPESGREGKKPSLSHVCGGHFLDGVEQPTERNQISPGVEIGEVHNPLLIKSVVSPAVAIRELIRWVPQALSIHSVLCNDA